MDLVCRQYSSSTTHLHMPPYPQMLCVHLIWTDRMGESNGNNMTPLSHSQTLTQQNKVCHKRWPPLVESQRGFSQFFRNMASIFEDCMQSALLSALSKVVVAESARWLLQSNVNAWAAYMGCRTWMLVLTQVSLWIKPYKNGILSMFLLTFYFAQYHL